MQSMEELSRVHVIGDAPYRELIVCNLDSSDIMLTLQGLKLHLLHTSTSSMSAASVATDRTAFKGYYFEYCVTHALIVCLICF